MRLNHFQQIQTSFQKKIGPTLQRWTSVLDEVVEQIDGRHPKKALNLALDLLKPYLQTLGLRVSKLSDQAVEVVLPYKTLHQDINLELDEGALCSAAVFAFRTLWKRNAPKGAFEVQILKLDFERVREAKGELRIRMDLPHLTREALFAEMSEHKKTQHEGSIQIYDADNQVVAKVQIQAELRFMEAIEWK